MGEAVFLNLLKERGIASQWEVDSAGLIDYHVGEGPDKRTLSVLASHGIKDYRHIVRQVNSAR